MPSVHRSGCWQKSPAEEKAWRLLVRVFQTWFKWPYCGCTKSLRTTLKPWENHGFLVFTVESSLGFLGGAIFCPQFRRNHKLFIYCQGHRGRVSCFFRPFFAPSYVSDGYESLKGQTTKVMFTFKCYLPVREARQSS